MHISGKWEAARDAVTKLAAELESGRDHIALFSFDNELHVVQPFTTSPSDVVRRAGHGAAVGIDGDVRRGGGNRQEACGRRRHARRAIVVVTDGLDNRQPLDATDVSAAASAIDVPVYSFVVSSALDKAASTSAIASESGALTKSRGTLDDLSRWTGGARYVSAHAGGNGGGGADRSSRNCAIST